MNEENKINVVEYLQNRRDFALDIFLKTGLLTYHGIAFRAKRRLAALKIGDTISKNTRNLGTVAVSLIARAKLKNARKGSDFKNDNSLNIG